MRSILPRDLSRFFEVLFFSLLLSACGGGGGGGGGASGGGSGGSTPPPSVSTFHVALSLSAITVQGEEGMVLAPIVVTGTGSGTTPDTVYLGSSDLGSAIDHVQVEGSGANAKFTVYVKSTLPVGDHRGTLLFAACRDEKCASHVTGSPINVPYTITIAKGFKLNTGALQFAVASGASASADVALQLPAGQSSATLTPTVPWLTVSNQTLNGFTVIAKPMPPGSYQGSVVATAGSRSISVAVDYTVSGAASNVTGIVPDRTSVSLVTMPASSVSGILNVSLPAWTNELNTNVQYLSNFGTWLSIGKHGDRSLSLTAYTSMLSAGTYQAIITLSSGAGIAPVTVPVTLTVGEARMALSGSTAFAVRGDTTASQLASDITISLPNMPPQLFTVKTTSPWLKLSQDTGTTGGAPVRISVDSAEMLKLPNFKSHSAELTFTPVAIGIPALKVSIILDKALPELNYVSPNTRLPNEGGVYTLRGRGLGSAANPASGLSVIGAVPTQVTRVNDTTIRVRLPPVASGDVSFSAGNGLGVQTGAPVLSVVSQPAFPYAAIGSIGEKSGLVVDAQRNTLYSVDRSVQAILRYRWNGGSWDTSTTALPGVDGVALSPDGKILVAVAAPGSIVLFDSSTMDRLASYEADRLKLGYTISTQRVAVTNDGRVWYAGDNYHGLSYFDLVTRERGVFAADSVYAVGDGPWFSVSGDGSRLNVALDRFGEPIAYLDDGDGVMRFSPSGYSHWALAPQSLRGERFVEEQGRVWDRNFAPVGTLVSPDTNYFGQRHAVSPDGSRVYLLAYHATNSYSSVKPRVFVFDSSTPLGLDAHLPVLGYFDIDDYPTCHDGNIFCKTYAIGRTSPDGKTLFFIGNEKLLVVPIPALTPVAAQAGAVSARGLKMTRVPPGR